MSQRAPDLIVVGAGAAGLMAATAAARATPGGRILLLEGARRVGAKILVSGGGRCNVTNRRVVARDFCGASRKRIDRVLRRFPVEATRDFFSAQGLELVEEDWGKLFPVTGKARSVLDALVAAAGRAGVEIRPGHRVVEVRRHPDGFELQGEFGSLHAPRVALTTGGKSLPKSGSDGWGYQAAQRLGHSLTPHLLPALVPLTLPEGHPLRALAGTASEVELRLEAASGKGLERAAGPMLLTHVGVSGPAALDISRHWLLAGLQTPGCRLRISWVPGHTPEGLDRELAALPARSLVRALAAWMPRRLAEVQIGEAGIDTGSRDAPPREARRALVAQLTGQELPIVGDLGFSKAEVTAGGVPLDEVDLATMESRRCPGLYLAGEILDVDGRLGGFNFQWAWASGHVAGVGAAQASSRSSA